MPVAAFNVHPSIDTGATGKLGCDAKTAILTHGLPFERPALRFVQNLLHFEYYLAVNHRAIDGNRRGRE